MKAKWKSPLEGIRILDLSTVIAARLARRCLVDFGADVIKVEMPNVGIRCNLVLTTPGLRY